MLLAVRELDFAWIIMKSRLKIFIRNLKVFSSKAIGGQNYKQRRTIFNHLVVIINKKILVNNIVFKCQGCKEKIHL